MNTTYISKKLINKVDRCVDDSLKGFASLYPSLRLHSEHRFMSTYQETERSHVAILSGGGSGHEPFCTGYVGDGMLSGAVAGSVFASPPKSNILYGINYLHSFYKGGVLVIIPNYTGDRLNFGMAVENAKNSGLAVESLMVGEDCASDNDTAIGRRGMCGLLFMYKFAGALAQEGQNLTDITATLQKVLKNLSTLGITLRACALPDQPPLFHLADDEIELGTGVHGEAGIEKLKLGTAKDAVNIILEKLCTHLKLKTGCRLAVLINNLGSTSQIEQNIVASEVYDQLVNRGLKIERIYAGMLMTSLDMAGFQVSILNIPPKEDNWLRLLDANTCAPKWVGCQASIPLNKKKEFDCSYIDNQKDDRQIRGNIKLNSEDQLLFKRCLRSVADDIIAHENRLNELDSGCGDGDCGTTLRHLGVGILESIPTLDFQSPPSVLHSLAEISEVVIGGTSGALYSIGFTAAAKAFIVETQKKVSDCWIEALSNAANSIMKYGGAEPGDRSMVDSLVAAADTAQKYKSSKSIPDLVEKMTHEAKAACEATRHMKARAGRASYVAQDRIVDMDAGAYGVVIWLTAILEAIKKH